MIESEASSCTIAEQDRDIRAWAHLAPDALTEGPPPRVGGPLAGLRFGVKDVMDVRGMPTRHGAALKDAPVARFDAACVAMLRAAGAIPVGKTVTAEFAYMAPGPTRNPWRLAHTPGGSSSGSAAAVAAGMVPMCLGTQTGGSIIRPAAFNGVVGFKPSLGRVPRTGMLVSSDSLDTIGWFTRDVALCRQVAAIFMGDAPPAASSPLRVAVMPAPEAGTLDADARAVLDQAAADLAARGAQVTWQEAPALFRTALEVHECIMRYEVARGLLPVLQAEPEALRPVTRDCIRQGLAITAGEYDQALARQAQLRAEWLDRLAEFDVILTPSAPGTAPEGHASTGTSVFNRTWSLLGWPCIHLPLGEGQHGLPLGVQCIGKPGRDLDLLTQAERIHPWLDRRRRQLPDSNHAAGTPR